jgi:hypothetical protein
MSGGRAVIGQKRGTRLLPEGRGLDGQGVADPQIQNSKWAYQPEQSAGHSPAPRPVKGQPQERQHSAAPTSTAGRDAGPTAPGERLEIFLRERSSPERAETRHPALGICGGLVSAASRARSGKAGCAIRDNLLDWAAR